MKKVLTIAGSDTSGGAGIQADLKTFEERNTYGMSATTVIVAMDPDQAWSHQIFPIPMDTIKAQIKTALQGVGADALKTGMLPTVEIIEYVGSLLKDMDIPLVIDPVLACKVNDGVPHNLFPENVEAMRKYLLPHASLVTPNDFEAAQLAGMDLIQSLDDAKEAAKRIHALGAKNVVIKRREGFGGDIAIDLLYDGQNFTPMGAPKVPTKWTHGAGCTYSACITAELAKGHSVKEAVMTAKALITRALEHSFALNQFVGPVDHTQLRD